MIHMTSEESRCQGLVDAAGALLREARSLSEAALAGVQEFGQQGVPFPESWTGPYADWLRRRKELEEQVSALVPGLESLNSVLPDWIKALSNRASKIRAESERTASALFEVRECLRRVQGLRGARSTALVPELEAPRALAATLTGQLDSSETRQLVLDDSAGQLDSLRAILEVLDSRRQNDAEKAACKAALKRVSTVFDLDLAFTLASGDVTAPSRIKPPVAPVVVRDALSADEAMQRLTLGQVATEARPLAMAPVPSGHSFSPADMAQLPIPMEELLVVSQRMNADLKNWNLWGEKRETTATYHAAIEAISLIQSIASDPRRESDTARYREEFKQAVQHLASVQSALRVQAEPLRDENQFQIFHWLQRVTKEHSVFVAKHMKLTDPAAASDIPAIREQLQQAQLRWEAPKQRAKILKRITYELGKTATDPAAWDAVFRQVEELVVREKTPPSNVELRELLLPHLDRIPQTEEPNEAFLAVQRAMDDFLRSVEGRDADAAGPQGMANPEVEELKAILAGRKVILIGGIPDPHGKARLEHAFGLEELVWVEARHEESISPIALEVRDPAVVLVLVVVRWMSHAHGNVKKQCVEVNKPFVMLQGTTHPNRVAHDVMAQCGHMLRQELIPA